MNGPERLRLSGEIARPCFDDGPTPPPWMA